MDETIPPETATSVSSDDISSQFTRSKASNVEFNWKNNCFICGQKCNPKQRKTWSMVESAIDKKSNLYTQVLNAAQIRHDKDVVSRLLSSNGDLVAVEARYHRKKVA